MEGEYSRKNYSKTKWWLASYSGVAGKNTRIEDYLIVSFYMSDESKHHKKCDACHHLKSFADFEDEVTTEFPCCNIIRNAVAHQ